MIFVCGRRKSPRTRRRIAAWLCVGVLAVAWGGWRLLSAENTNGTENSSSGLTSYQEEALSPAPTASPQADSKDPPAPSGQSLEESDVFRILDAATGEILQVSGREFLYGAVVTEMTLYMHEEALKAQAAACYSFYSWTRAQHTQDEYDFTCDTANWLVYVPREVMKEKWGDAYEDYMAILDRVVDAVYGQVLTYNGEAACTSYFAISSGQTENSEDVWGGEIPYLTAVASPGDSLAGGYQTSASFTPQELAQALGCTASDDGSQMVEILERTASGSVTRVRIGENEYDGGEVRTALGLRSANFSTAWDGEKIVFTVKGWGHGVGMSQAGADYLAQTGFTWQEILDWYYPGTTLSPAEDLLAG